MEPTQEKLLDICKLLAVACNGMKNQMLSRVNVCVFVAYASIRGMLGKEQSIMLDDFSRSTRQLNTKEFESYVDSCLKSFESNSEIDKPKSNIKEETSSETTKKEKQNEIPVE